MSSTLKRTGLSPTPLTREQGPRDLENVDLSAVDYVPAVEARGFAILGATGAVKIDTPEGTTITIPSGLSTGIFHPIPFTKMYKTGTTATSILAGS